MTRHEAHRLTVQAGQLFLRLNNWPEGMTGDEMSRRGILTLKAAKRWDRRAERLLLFGKGSVSA